MTHVTITWLSCDYHVAITWLSCDDHVILCAVDQGDDIQVIDVILQGPGVSSYPENTVGVSHFACVLLAKVLAGIILLSRHATHVTLILMHW